MWNLILAWVVYALSPPHNQNSPRIDFNENLTSNVSCEKWAFWFGWHMFWKIYRFKTICVRQVWIGFHFVGSLSNARCFPINYNSVTYKVDLQCYVMLGWEYIVHPHLPPMCLVLVSSNIPWIMEWIESQMGSLSQVRLFLGFYLFHRERSFETHWTN